MRDVEKSKSETCDEENTFLAALVRAAEEFAAAANEPTQGSGPDPSAPKDALVA